MSVTDRWIACLRRRAGAQVKRAEFEAMQHGLLPAGWVYGLNDRRQAEYDEQRRILLERHKNLYREPVSGPDRVTVALWYAGTAEYRVPLVVPYTPWPGSPPGRLAALLDQYIRVMNRIMPGASARGLARSREPAGETCADQPLCHSRPRSTLAFGMTFCTWAVPERHLGDTTSVTPSRSRTSASRCRSVAVSPDDQFTDRIGNPHA